MTLTVVTVTATRVVFIRCLKGPGDISTIDKSYARRKAATRIAKQLASGSTSTLDT